MVEKMHCHIGCICLVFIHYAFSNVSSDNLPKRMYNYIGCTCLAFLHYAFSNEISNCLLERKQSVDFKLQIQNAKSTNTFETK